MVVDGLVDLGECLYSLGVGIGVDPTVRVRVMVMVRVTVRCLSIIWGIIIMHVGMIMVVCGLDARVWAMVCILQCLW